MKVIAVSCLLLALAASTGCTTPPSTASRSQPTIDCRQTDEYDDLESLADDFDQAPSVAGIVGGDIAVTTSLSRTRQEDAELLMAFGDPILETSSLDAGGARETTVRNALLAFTADRACLVLGPQGSAFVPNRRDGIGYWPTSLVETGERSAAMFLQRVAEVHDGDFINLGPSIAELRITADGLPFVEEVIDIGVDEASRQRIGWGAASWRADDGYVYVYGTANPERDLVFGWSLHVARARPDHVVDIESWEYWTGDDWSTEEGSATAVIPAVGGVDQTLSVFAEGATWYAVSKRDGYLGSDVVIWSAPAPTGPWTATEVAAARPSHPESGILRYAALAHPALFPEQGTIVLSVSNNNTDPDAVAADPTLYRPEFFRVPLP